MKQFFSRSWLAAVLAALSGGVGPANAGSCGPAGCGGGGVGFSDFGYEGFGFNRAWVYPEGGYTVYPGQPGSCFPSHSDYSKVNWTVPPTVNAQGVLNKLRSLGIPQVPPDTIYLGKNPRAADNVQLPTPKGWIPREDEPKEAEPKNKELDKPKEKDAAKPKDTPKPKDVDDPEGTEKPTGIDEFKGKGLDLPKVEPKSKPEVNPKG